MGRPRKLTKYQLKNALAAAHGNISAVARMVHSARNTVKAAMRFWGLFARDYRGFGPPQNAQDGGQVGAVAVHAEPKLLPQPLSPKLLPAPTPETEIGPLPAKLEALGITQEQLAHTETCSSLGCGICGQVEQRRRKFEATLEHTLRACWCGKQHMLTPQRQGSGSRAANKLAMSYAPRRGPWER